MQIKEIAGKAAKEHKEVLAVVESKREKLTANGHKMAKKLTPTSKIADDAVRVVLASLDEQQQQISADEQKKAQEATEAKQAKEAEQAAVRKALENEARRKEQQEAKRKADEQLKKLRTLSIPSIPPSGPAGPAVGG